MSNYRWHVLDPIPYERSIAFYMELFSHERTAGFSYARISYHYAKQGLVDDHVTITDEALQIPRLPATWEPEARFGASGCVFVPCEECPKGRASTTILEGPLWQGGKLLLWTPGQTGEKLRLAFTVPDDGDYDLFLTCMFCPDGGDIPGGPGRRGNRVRGQ